MGIIGGYTMEGDYWRIHNGGRLLEDTQWREGTSLLLMTIGTSMQSYIIRKLNDAK